MNPIFDFLKGVLRLALRLWMLALLGALLVSVLVLGISVALLSVLWSLLRGRKPAMVSVFQTFRQASRPFEQGLRKRPAQGAGEVVDVQAHEVRPALEGDEEHDGHQGHEGR